MKIIVVALVCASAFGIAVAQAQSGTPEGPTATSKSGDPAAGSASGGGKTASNPSGSGTSTSGGKDANGDNGRDKMPDSSVGVRPPDKQNKH